VHRSVRGKYSTLLRRSGADRPALLPVRHHANRRHRQGEAALDEHERVVGRRSSNAPSKHKLIRCDTLKTAMTRRSRAKARVRRVDRDQFERRKSAHQVGGTGRLLRARPRYSGSKGGCRKGIRAFWGVTVPRPMNGVRPSARSLGRRREDPARCHGTAHRQRQCQFVSTKPHVGPAQ